MIIQYFVPLPGNIWNSVFFYMIGNTCGFKVTILNWLNGPKTCSYLLNMWHCCLFSFLPRMSSCISYSLQMAKLIDSSIFEDENSKFLYPARSSRGKLVSNHHCHHLSLKFKKQIFAKSLPNFKTDLSWWFLGSHCVLWLR